MTPFVSGFTTLISLGAIAGQVFVVLVAAGFALPKTLWLRQLEMLVSRYSLQLVIVISGAAMLGSLFYSEIAGFEPCRLCIMQRWLLYPLPFIAALGFRHGSRRALKAVMVLASGAFLIALYQYILQLYGGVSPFCTPDLPCDKVFFISFGYITIPLLSVTNAAMLLVTAAAGLREKHLNQ